MNSEPSNNKPRGVGAPVGNKNRLGKTGSTKPDHLKRTSMLQIPVTPREKAALVKAACGEKLTDYCRRKLEIVD